MKLCKDCVHRKAVNLGGTDFSTCQRTSGVDPVTGNGKESIWKYCSTNRNPSWLAAVLIGACGAGGRWFSPKN